MRVLVAPCSFKGTLSSSDAAAAMARGVSRAAPEAELLLRPLADGGEGTLEVLRAALGGSIVETRVRDALLRPRRAGIALFPDGGVGVEAATAIGLPLLRARERRPLRASSAGVGDLVLAALDALAGQIDVALGGTATVDGGLGMLQALGALALDDEGNALAPGGGELWRLRRLDLSALDPRLARVRLRGLIDVQSPLLGPRGARLFMRQKGASPRACDVLERGLVRFASVVREERGFDVDVAGAGAAGGIGAALLVLGAELTSGADHVLRAQDIHGALARVDLALTGEGSLDAQTGEGKAIERLSRLCRAAHVPLLALSGRVEQEAARALGLAAAHALGGPRRPAARALEEATAAAVRAHLAAPP